MSSQPCKPKINGLVMLPERLLVHQNCLLLTVATDGKDGDGLELGQCFQVPEMCSIHEGDRTEQICAV